MSIEVKVGGRPRTLADGATVATLLGDRPTAGVAVARNGEVVPRGQWAATALADGDEMEIVQAVQGG